MPGLRDSAVMRVLSDFYWTAATVAGLFTSQTKVPDGTVDPVSSVYVKQRNAQRHAEHCVQAAGALC